jgi:hyperosmotically inducible protein
MIANFSTKLALGLAAPLITAALLAPACVAKAQQGAAERVGQGLDSAGRNIRRGVQTAFPRARAMVHEQEVLSRVYSRLHWDKVLVGSTLEIEVRDNGVAVLRGAVVDDAARRRAVNLTTDTVGVAQVIDELTVVAPPRVIESVPPASPVPPAAATVRP